jgi:uncharacterized membrane protein HdeD (DUF308 family)
MGLGYRIARSVIILFPALLSITTQLPAEGISFAFAAALLSGAFLTLIYLFLHFDEFVNPKLIMELLTDAFVGIVLVTFPSPSQAFAQRYFLIMFSVWLFINGMLIATSGIMDKENKNLFWLYVLIGIAYISMGFVIMNYDDGVLNSAYWLVSFMLIIYSGISIYLLLSRKKDYFPSRSKE